MTEFLTPFPTLLPEPAEEWVWPAPPFEWSHRAAPPVGAAQPCRLETLVGTPVDGEMLGFEPARGLLTFRSTAASPPVELSFARFRRLTLTAPLLPSTRAGAGPVERVPVARHEREYRLQPAGTAAALIGRTAGRIERPAGLFLFTPYQDETSLQRVFVPHAAYVRCEFGPTAEEVAARRWIANPTDLLAAIERQQRMPIQPLGQSLLELGFLTPGQLERALAAQSGDTPLGESLVATGLLSRTNLQTALAHKMGYPLVDLGRFPIDPRALAKIPPRLAIGYRAMPLMLHQDRLIVAVDKPARILKLRTVFAQHTIVPVLASRMQIMTAQERLSQDVWSDHRVPERIGFFATTL